MHQIHWQAKLRRRAPTLIEPLVVIAIIAILAGLLHPALSRAKWPGKSARCLCNMRQLAFVADLYVEDNFAALEGRPKMQSRLFAPYLAKLFLDNGADWQGVSLQVTMRRALFSIPITPVPQHRGGLNVALGDGAARFLNRVEFNSTNGPSIPLQDHPRKNWWREGAVVLAP